MGGEDNRRRSAYSVISTNHNSRQNSPRISNCNFRSSIIMMMSTYTIGKYSSVGLDLYFRPQVPTPDRIEFRTRWNIIIIIIITGAGC